jgi:rhodanese-related sulfurtransferase
VFVYCAAGGRSAEAAAALKQLGHREVYNLAGGIDAWERAGLPVVKP